MLALTNIYTMNRFTVYVTPKCIPFSSRSPPSALKYTNSLPLA